MNCDTTINHNDKCVIWLNNPFDYSDFSRDSVEQPVTIKAWLDSHGGESRLNRMPTVCVYKGKELLRCEYDQLIEEPVWFITLPAGGDRGTNPINAMLTLALALWAPGFIGSYAWAQNAAGTALGGYGALATAGIVLGGGALINMVFPHPDAPGSAGFSTGSPTYALGAQGNQARLGQPIPVNYGKMRIYPDFAARPYTEYESNEQYLYQLFCIGQGWNNVSNIRLDNTSIENFEEATVQIVNPHEKVTLFHTAVVQAPEAGGQDLTEPIELGPYVINNKGTEISRVACDVVFPAGLVGVNEKNGKEYSVAVHLRIWVDPIDDDDQPSGGRIIVWDFPVIDKTRTAIRRTFGKDVPPGRYQMSIQRTTSKPDKNEVKNCSLGAMKGYLVDNNEYGDVTLLAMRVRATANLSDAASRLVNVISERRIPTWTPDEGWTVHPVLTRNPAWAFADAIRARYGGDFPDSEIDLHGLHYLAGLFDSRGDKFDGRFDTENNLWDALGRIGQVCRSGPIRQGNLYRMIRDQHQDAPVQVFGMSNMSDFSIDYVMHDDHTADSVKVTYWDEARDYVETTITAQLPDDSNDHPQEITLFGCTDYEQAWREGMYLAASNRERRQMVSWTTELEGHIPTFGDVVWVNHDLLGTGQQFGGTVAGIEGDVLTLSRDVQLSGSDDTWYIIIRDRYGGPSPPIPIEAVDTHRVRLLDKIPDIETAPDKEPSHFMIGLGSHYAFPVKITAITPEADDRVAIAGCIESEFVHTADEGEIPAPPPDFKPPPPGLEIEDLRATQGGTVDSPVISLSWAFALGADHYQIETRLADSDLWQPAGSGLSLVNHHEFVSEPGDIVCRVAAVAAVRGEWAEITVSAGGDFDTPGQVEITLSEPFEGEAMRVEWEIEPAAARYLLEVHSKDRYRRGLYLERDITRYEYHWQDAQKDSAGRTITIQVQAINAEDVRGEWGSVTATNPPPAVPDNVEVTGLLDSLIARCDKNTEPDILELRVYGEQDSGFTPAPGNLLGSDPANVMSVPVPVDTTWYVRLAWVDVWGASELNFSGEYKATAERITETEIGPESISTPLLKANAVTTDKLSAGSVTAEKIEAGIITGEHIEAGSISAEDAVFEKGAIQNADIGNVIQSDNYDEGKAGWILRKDGYFESQNAYIRGRIHGSEITGSVIQGSVIIGSDDMLIPTEADRGPGSTRFLTYIEPFSISGSGKGNIPYSDENPPEHSVSTKIMCHVGGINAADFTGHGETNGVWNNYRRYKKYKIYPDISFDSGSMTTSVTKDYGYGSAGPIKLEFDIKIAGALTVSFFLDCNDFNNSSGWQNFSETKSGIRFSGRIHLKAITHIDKPFNGFFNRIETNIYLSDFSYTGNAALTVEIDANVTRSFWYSGSGVSIVAPSFDFNISLSDYSYDKDAVMLRKTDSSVLAALEKQFLSATDLYKQREQWRAVEKLKTNEP